MTESNVEAQSRYVPFPSFAGWTSSANAGAPLGPLKAALEEAKNTVSQTTLEAAVAAATRSAAIDTGAIEGLYIVDRGFTRTIATEAANWEIVFAAREETTQRAIEDALHTYDFVLDAATGSQGPITEVWIKHIHSQICASQPTYRVMTDQGWQDQELPKGEYKRFANSPVNLTTGREHQYPPVLDTAPEMARLVREISSDEFGAADTVLQAAYAHYAFVCVHPFADGNGRVARALASVFLYRSPGVPLVIFADQKNPYLDSLDAADAGDAAPFIDFVYARTAEAVQMVLIELERAETRQRQRRVLSNLRGTLESGVGLTHLEIDAVAERALELVSQKLMEAIGGLELPGGSQAAVSTSGNSFNLNNGYRNAVSVGGMRVLSLASGQPANASAVRQFAAFVRSTASSREPFIAVITDSNNRIGFELVDLEPSISAATELRAAAWADRQITDLLEAFQSVVEANLRQLGYLQ